MTPTQRAPDYGRAVPELLRESHGDVAEQSFPSLSQKGLKTAAKQATRRHFHSCNDATLIGTAHSHALHDRRLDFSFLQFCGGLFLIKRRHIDKTKTFKVYISVAAHISFRHGRARAGNPSVWPNGIVAGEWRMWRVAMTTTKKGGSSDLRVHGLHVRSHAAFTPQLLNLTS